MYQKLTVKQSMTSILPCSHLVTSGIPARSWPRSKMLPIPRLRTVWEWCSLGREMRIKKMQRLGYFSQLKAMVRRRLASIMRETKWWWDSSTATSSARMWWVPYRPKWPMIRISMWISTHREVTTCAWPTALVPDWRSSWLLPCRLLRKRFSILFLHRSPVSYFQTRAHLAETNISKAASRWATIMVSIRLAAQLINVTSRSVRLGVM